MDFPFFVVGEEDEGGDGAAVYEEDDADGEVGDDCAFDALLGGGDLHLGGYEDD